MKFKAMFTTAMMAAAAVCSFAAGSFNTVALPPPDPLLAAPTVPAASATAVPRNQKLAVTFSEAMDPMTINTMTFTLQQRGMPVFGWVAYDGATATFTPGIPLAPLTEYTATLTTGARTISGALLAGNLVWSFTTGPDVVLSPQLPVALGTAGNFVVLAGSAISFNGGASSITGDIGLSPTTGAAITAVALPTLTGTIYTVDGLCAMPDVMDVSRLTTAKNDLTTAYIDAAGRVTPDTIDINGANLGGQTLAPGLHKFTSSALLSGSNLTLSGPATGVWIFQIGSTLTVASGMRVMLAGGANWDNIFWQVGSSATMISGSHMEGNILAMDSIDFGTTATMQGRALARNGAVTFAGGFGGGLPTACATLAPATLNAVANTGTSSIDLNWAAVSGATSYNIYRATVSGGPYTLLTAVTAPATIYSDAAIVAGTTYYYVVRAFNACESVDSPQASAMLSACSAPTGVNAPTAADVSACAATGITVTWAAPTAWGDTSGTRTWTVLRNGVAVASGPCFGAIAGTTFTCTDTSAVAGTPYTYTVRANNGCGLSTTSTASASVTDVNNSPSAPATLNAVPQASLLGIDLSWGTVAGATSYNIYRAIVSGGPYTLLTTVSAPATTYSDTTALRGVPYYYVVRAFNGCESVNSPQASATIPATCSTLAPKALTVRVYPAAGSGISLSWKAVIGATSYNIYRATAPGGPYTLVKTISAPALSWADHALVLKVRYYYVVRAVAGCESGNSNRVSGIRNRCL